GDKHVAVLVEGDPPGLVELAGAAAGLAAFPDELAPGAEHLNPVVAAVDDDHIAALLDRDPGRTHELAVAAAGRSPFLEELAVGVEDRDRVGPFIRAVDPVASFVDGDAERPGTVAVAFAIFPKVGDQFLFAGPAKL